MIDGADLEAWAEDSWVGEVRIGNIDFKYNRDCTRCLATTVRKRTQKNSSNFLLVISKKAKLGLRAAKNSSNFLKLISKKAKEIFKIQNPNAFFMDRQTKKG